MASKTEDYIGGTALLTMILGPLAVLTYQVGYWLHFGHWRPLSPVILMDIYFRKLLADTWFTNPHSWHGLNKILMWVLDIPLSLALFFVGYFIIMSSEKDSD